MASEEITNQKRTITFDHDLFEFNVHEVGDNSDKQFDDIVTNGELLEELKEEK